ncbi:MAG TPA: two-component system response regulator NarL [Rhodocyclaceae bacterium]|nr:two-component system response regulator NarL [Rhodocyclaceae bacterium]
MNTGGNSVIVIDDHPLFRKGVSQLIAMDDQLKLVGEASSGEAGVALAQRMNPDLILLDLNMKGMGGIDTLRALREAGLEARVVMLTVSDHADDLIAAIRSGADGYLLKDMEPEELLARIKDALFGRMVISDSLNGLLAQALRDEAVSAGRSSADLTERERAILACLADGMSNKLIGRELNIAEGTVKVHVRNLLKKLSFRSRVEAAVWAVEHGQRGGAG